MNLPVRLLYYYPCISSRAATIFVGQVVNLRRIVNPPAALGRAATAFGESARAVCGLHTPIQAVLPMNRAAIRSPVAPAAAPQLYR